MPKGIYPRKPLSQRFWEKVDKDGPVPSYRPDLGPCWIWTASIAKGYGRSCANGKSRGAHIVAYEMLVGPVPDGLELDHLCRVRRCVNPAHLEPVTKAENVRRGTSPALTRARHKAKTHCGRGHPFDEANTRHRSDGSRQCIACKRRRNAERSSRTSVQSP